MIMMKHKESLSAIGPGPSVASQFMGIDLVKAQELVHAPGIGKDWHSHECAHFVLTLDGFSTEWFRNSRFERPERSVLFRPAGAQHWDSVGSLGARCFLIELNAAWIDTLPRSGSAFEQPKLYRLGPIASLAERIYREWLENDNASQIVIHALSLEMVAHLIREDEAKSGSRSPFWLRKVKQRLDDGFADTPTVAELASIANVHPAHLARQFRVHYKKSIGEYLRHCRVDAAMDLLVEPEFPLAEIALRTGFSHQAHFNRIFKRQMGLTPGEFRRLYGRRKSKITSIPRSKLDRSEA
jgi:AraC family transcriptional regulator